MDKIALLFAKLAALQKSFLQTKYGADGRIKTDQIDPLIDQYFSLREKLISELPDLFDDLPPVAKPKTIGKTYETGNYLYNRREIFPIEGSLEYIMEARSQYRIGENLVAASKPNRIFISHGRSNEWYKLQAYIDKTLKFQTLELAQEANMGRTVLQKLEEESNKCGYAVIVMTGDDKDGDLVKARENVMHEIGYFQGKYGLKNIILLHEEGVNIPSNIHGLVYISFPKGTIEVTFGAVHGELQVIMNS